MLLKLSKKICPLLTMLLAIGCGKQINETASSEVTRPSQNSDLPPVLSLQINEQQSPQTNYILPKNAWFKFPTALKVTSGNGIGKRVRIYYNLWPNGDYEYLCYYSSVSNPNHLAFEKCENIYNTTVISNVGDLEGIFPMEKNTTLKLVLQNPGQNLIIDSTYLVEWK
jgi:hypothetical protein